MMNNEEELDELLAEWKAEEISQPFLTERVLSRIASEENASPRQLGSYFNSLFALQISLASCVLLLIAVLFTHSYKVKFSNQSLGQLAALYSPHVDPLLNVEEELFGDTVSFLNEENMLKSLEWMKLAFNLDREQFHIVAQLHIEYKKDFIQIYNQLVVLNNDYKEFEELRIHSDQIDFLAFYDLLEKRKKLAKEYSDKSNKLIQLVSEVLDSEQRALYNKILPKQTLQKKTLPNVGYRTV